MWIPVGVAVLASLVLAGVCYSRKSECDLEATAQLAKRLDAVPASERVELILTELDDVCRTPDFVDAYLSNMDFEKRPGYATWRDEDMFEHQHEVFSRLCPKIAAKPETFTDAPWGQRSGIVFDTCELERLGVIERERYIRDDVSIVPWATFQWLEEQRVEREAAVSITRALLLLERRFNARLPAPKQLRVASVDGGTEVTGLDPIVYVATDELLFNSMPSATLDGGRFDPQHVQGHVVVHLFQDMSEDLEQQRSVEDRKGVESGARILIAADATIPYATLRDVIFTAARAGYLRFGLIAEVEPYAYELLPFEPVDFRTGRGAPDDDELALHVTIDEQGFVVRDSATPGAKAEPIGDQPAALAERAVAHRRAHPTARVAAFTLGEQMDVERISWAIAALRGRECRAPGAEDCVLPRVVLLLPG